MKQPQVKFKRLNGIYADSDRGTRVIRIDPRKNRSGVEFLDSVIHEKNHLANWKDSERGIIKKTEKDINSYLSII